jgi:hypothetical protein
MKNYESRIDIEKHIFTLESEIKVCRDSLQELSDNDPNKTRYWNEKIEKTRSLEKELEHYINRRDSYINK